MDVWGALRSDRPYRAGWPEEKVRNHIVEGSGTQFDPKAVQLFLHLRAEHPDLPALAEDESVPLAL